MQKSYKTKISNQKIAIEILNTGAELCSVINKNTPKEYIWDGNPAFWGKHSPILFPIVGTLKNDSYTYKNKNYTLSRHGFARDLDFTLVNKTETKAEFTLKANELTICHYPFDFELQIIYEIINTELFITYIVKNNDSATVPFSIGGHPAFALTEDFERYSLKFSADEVLNTYLLEKNLLSDKVNTIVLNNKTLPLSYSLFEKDALIIKSMQSDEIELLESNRPILKFKFRDFPNFGIWTKDNAPFICLEPWVGYSDVLETSGDIMQKEGILMLEPNHVKEFTFSIEFYT